MVLVFVVFRKKNLKKICFTGQSTTIQCYTCSSKLNEDCLLRPTKTPLRNCTSNEIINMKHLAQDIHPGFGGIFQVDIGSYELKAECLKQVTKGSFCF